MPRRAEQGITVPRRAEQGITVPRRAEQGIAVPRRAQQSIAVPRRTQQGTPRCIRRIAPTVPPLVRGGGGICLFACLQSYGAALVMGATSNACQRASTPMPLRYNQTQSGKTDSGPRRIQGDSEAPASRVLYLSSRSPARQIPGPGGFGPDYSGRRLRPGTRTRRGLGLGEDSDQGTESRNVP